MGYQTTIIGALSGNLRKAVEIYAQDFEFSTLETAEAAPSGDGVHELISGEHTVSSRIYVLPYCLGCEGSVFWMRVSGWWNLGNDPATQVWIRNILGVYQCQAGRHRGFKGRLLNEEERLAISSIYVPTNGVKKIEFEFICDLHRRVDMNALWAIA